MASPVRSDGTRKTALARDRRPSTLAGKILWTRNWARSRVCLPASTSMEESMSSTVTNSSTPTSARKRKCVGFRNKSTEGSSGGRSTGRAPTGSVECQSGGDPPVMRHPHLRHRTRGRLFRSTASVQITQEVDRTCACADLAIQRFREGCHFVQDAGLWPGYRVDAINRNLRSKESPMNQDL